MGANRLSSGSELLDGLLDGGYEKDIITTIYGPSGSGKTNLCMMCAIDVVKNGKKVIFIDTEGGFSISRLKQLTQKSQEVLESILFLKPTNFKEQKQAFENLKDQANEKIGLIIIDTISMLYRLELGKGEDSYNINRELGQQLAYLAEIVRKKGIPVLLTSQVYANFEDKNRVNLVGGDVLKYTSKCLIELQKAHSNKRKAVLRKHRSMAEGKEAIFEIIDAGIKEFTPNNI
jgi:DNA repair protein RadB